MTSIRARLAGLERREQEASDPATATLAPGDVYVLTDDELGRLAGFPAGHVPTDDELIRVIEGDGCGPVPPDRRLIATMAAWARERRTAKGRRRGTR